MVGRTRDFWDRVAPIQAQINAYNDIQVQIRTLHEKWEHTTRSQVHMILTEIVETTLPGWSVTELKKDSNGVTLIMPQPKSVDSEQSVAQDIRTLTAGSLGFGAIHNGRIAVLMSFPRSKDEPKTLNMLDIVNPNTLTPSTVCQYVTEFIRQVTEWSKMDRTDAEERDNKDWR